MAVFTNPRNANAYYLRGQLHLVEHRFAEAIEDFSQSIRMQLDHANAYLYRGFAFTYQGKQEAALDDFSNFIRLNPESADGYYDRAVMHYNLGGFQEALADFTQAIEIDPNHTSNYYGRSNTYIQLNLLEEAIIDFDQARELEPDYPIYSGDQHGFYHAGLAHHYQGHSPSAMKHLNYALRLCRQHHDNKMAEIVTNTIQSIETREIGEFE
ncbi:MAG: tetratricopeptide repeat protein [Coleofasciculaceae cyanobacterium SM2_1_6]|nr:tetratricopeptide repeat protein [Coleofasciculaceae cyanobacterium SM2_1_6]